MSERNRAMKKVDEALAHNFEEFLEHGPGLRYSTQTAVAARCPTGKHVLVTGLGGMGIGSMWHPASDYREKLGDLWSELPVEQCCDVSESCKAEVKA